MFPTDGSEECFTNFKTMRSRVAKLNEIDKLEETGDINLLPKKEIIKLMGERKSSRRT